EVASRRQRGGAGRNRGPHLAVALHQLARDQHPCRRSAGPYWPSPAQSRYSSALVGEDQWNPSRLAGESMEGFESLASLPERVLMKRAEWRTHIAMFSSAWDERFMLLALQIASWSKEKGRRVGAVIVGPDKEIRSTGFNGFPRGVRDDVEARHRRETGAKY